MKDFEIELGNLVNEMISDESIDQMIEALDIMVLLLEERRWPAVKTEGQAVDPPSAG